MGKQQVKLGFIIAGIICLAASLSQAQSRFVGKSAERFEAHQFKYCFNSSASQEDRQTCYRQRGLVSSSANYGLLKTESMQVLEETYNDVLRFCLNENALLEKSARLLRSLTNEESSKQMLFRLLQLPVNASAQQVQAAVNLPADRSKLVSQILQSASIPHVTMAVGVTCQQPQSRISEQPPVKEVKVWRRMTASRR